VREKRKSVVRRVPTRRYRTAREDVMRLLCAVTVMSVLMAGSSFPQESKNVVSLQPLLTFGFANVEYERAFAQKTSFAVRVDVLYRRGQVEEDEHGHEYEVELNGFGGGGSLRFYPLGNAPKRA